MLPVWTPSSLCRTGSSMLSLPICLSSAEEQGACRCLHVRAGSPESASASAWLLFKELLWVMPWEEREKADDLSHSWHLVSTSMALLWQAGKAHVVGKRNQRGDLPRRGNNWLLNHHGVATVLPGVRSQGEKSPTPQVSVRQPGAFTIPLHSCERHILSVKHWKWCYQLFLCCLRVEKNPVIPDNLPELKTITVNLLSGHAVIYILEQTIFAPIFSLVITSLLGSKEDLNWY